MVSNHKDALGDIVWGQLNPKTNKLHGFGIVIDLDGRIFEGQMDENGKLQGHGQAFHSDGDYYAG